MSQSIGGTYQLQLSHNFKLKDVFAQGHKIGIGNVQLNLPESKKLEDIVEKGQNDGIDQVYFEVDGQYFMAEGNQENLKALKDARLPQVQIVLNGKEQTATILAKDNETNSAWEGVKAAGSATLGFMTAGLLGGGALLGKGFIQVNQGLTLTSGSLAAAQKGMSRVAAHTSSAKVGVSSLEAIKKLPQLLKNTYKHIIPGTTVTQSITTQSPKAVQQAIASAQKGMAVVEKGASTSLTGAQVAAKGSGTMRTGLYIAAAGVAIGSAIALGGAIYGANRSTAPEQLSEFRKNAVDFSTL